MAKEIYKAAAYVNKAGKKGTVTLDEVKDIFKLTVFDYPQFDFTKVYSENQLRSLCDSKSVMKQLLEDAKSGEFDLIVFSSVKAVLWDSATIFQTFREITHQATPVYIYFEYENLFISDDDSLDRLQIEITLCSHIQERSRRYSERLARRRKEIKTITKEAINDLRNV